MEKVNGIRGLFFPAKDPDGRVSGLDAMVQQPRAPGISAEGTGNLAERPAHSKKNLAWLFHRTKGIVDRRLVQYRRRCGGSKSCAKHRQQKRVATCQFRCEDNAR
jgi:hypothetical protein